MSPPKFRKEREVMPRGTRVSLFRVVKALPGARWGSVQCGMTEFEADALLIHLQDIEMAKARRKYGSTAR